VTDLEGKIARLEAYEERRYVTPLDFEQIIEPDLWERHRQNSQRVLQEMNEVQDLAVEITAVIKTIEPRHGIHSARRSPARHER